MYININFIKNRVKTVKNQLSFDFFRDQASQVISNSHELKGYQLSLSFFTLITPFAKISLDTSTSHEIKLLLKIFWMCAIRT